MFHFFVFRAVLNARQQSAVQPLRKALSRGSLPLPSPPQATMVQNCQFGTTFFFLCVCVCEGRPEMDERLPNMHTCSMHVLHTPWVPCVLVLRSCGGSVPTFPSSVIPLVPLVPLVLAINVILMFRPCFLFGGVVVDQIVQSMELGGRPWAPLCSSAAKREAQLENELVPMYIYVALCRVGQTQTNLIFYAHGSSVRSWWQCRVREAASNPASRAHVVSSLSSQACALDATPPPSRCLLCFS